MSATFRSALVCGLVLLAGRQEIAAQSSPGTPMTVCEGKYALCPAAPCVALPAKVNAQSGTPTEALCDCAVAFGANLGADPCDVRATGDEEQYLISTYSYGLVATHPSMTCTSGAYTNCFGSPCIVDEKDPTRARCTCPIEQNTSGQKFVTQGGQCDTSTCTTVLWSAATVAQNAFANAQLAAGVGLQHAPENRCAPRP
jgi:hypothetical protein